MKKCLTEVKHGLDQKSVKKLAIKINKIEAELRLFIKNYDSYEFAV
jgi:hypothetical protein